MSDIRIPASQAAAMDYLLLLVSTGYRYWHAGKVVPSKALAFAARMADLYPISRNAAGRAYDRSKDLASVHLVMFPGQIQDKAGRRPESVIRWWLLSTPGKGLIHEREKLSDAFVTTPVFAWSDDGRPKYLMTRGVRAGRSTARWTWSFEPTYFKMLLASAKEAADAGPNDLKDLFSRLQHVPMFGGVRDQMREIDDYARKTWAKQKKSPYPQVLPSTLPTMPKIEVFKDAPSLAALVERMLERTVEADRADLAAAENLLLIEHSSLGIQTDGIACAAVGR